jgi:phage shock protein PspC (stress-responsive transcriptional regulator)
VNDRLYRSPTDRVIAGVAGGIAAWLHVDPSIVRVAWVIAALFSFGLFVLVYLVMMIVVPLAPDGWAPPLQPRATPGGDAVPGWNVGSAGPESPWPASPGPQGVPGPQAGPAPASAWQPSSQASWDGTSAARSGRMVGGTVLVVLGLWLLVGQYVHIDWNLLWPLFVIGAGVLLIAAALRRRGR